MSNDTFDGIARKVLLRSPSTQLTLAYDWVRSSFRDVIERRRWSWMLKRGQIIVPAQYNTGTLTTGPLTSDATLGGGAVVSSAFIGRQLHVGNQPIVTIVTTLGSQVFTDATISATVMTNVSYTIYQAYTPLPADFHSFISIIDPSNAQPIPFGAGTGQIDNLDPQRSDAGSPPRAIVYFDYYNGQPRYEIWPHPRTAAIYPFLYESRPIDAFDANATVPTLLPSDVILERALMYCARWPGISLDNPNPMFSEKTSSFHEMQYEKRMVYLEKADNEHMQQDIWYQSDQTRNTAVLSGTWMQSHDLV